MNIEQPALGAPGLTWFKSSHSSGEGGNCIEVATTPGTVHVRDSKDKMGLQLAFSPTAWASFVTFAAEI
ncbi:DUF397 domain-containing protein [Kitasatospora herbaricolor]|uniref:DUF397 domain-containing protein n=1 Tax=Kitasatospora herbaricolor TaxID=68217 RepID=A0ABZ1WFH8_9ACTN|nr:DUF397 domain-containing protein [Kitasatospora herbaricolor]